MKPKEQGFKGGLTTSNATLIYLLLIV